MKVAYANVTTTTVSVCVCGRCNAGICLWLGRLQSMIYKGKKKKALQLVFIRAVCELILFIIFFMLF